MTSLGDAAPTRSSDFCAQSAAMSCQAARGEFSMDVKWPLTPIEAHVSSWASRYCRMRFGWAPSEFPTK
jgi:hypothetical protein